MCPDHLTGKLWNSTWYIYNIYENSFQSSGFISLCLTDPWRRPLSRSMSWDLIILRSQCQVPRGPARHRTLRGEKVHCCCPDPPPGMTKEAAPGGALPALSVQLASGCPVTSWIWSPRVSLPQPWVGGQSYMTWSDESHSSEVLEASPVHAPTEPAGAAKTERRGGRAQQVQMQAAAVPPAPVPGPRGLLPHPPDLLRMESTVFCAHYMFTWVKLQTLD